MGVVICMASSKGGSGKTILTATFAALLAATGRKILIVDTDAATNGLSLLYLDEVLAARDHADVSEGPPLLGTYELPLGEATEYAFVHIPTGAALLPATVEFFNTEHVPAADQDQRLHAAVSAWRDEFDYVILDAQAGSDVHAATSMSLADRVVIVSEYDPLSAAGVERLKALYPKQLAYERTWVLLNKMLPDLVEGYSDFMEVARYLRPIPWDAAVVRAYARRSLALDLDYGNEYTVAVIGTLRPLLSKSDLRDLDAWVETRAAEIRTPIGLRADDLRKELKGLERLQHDQVATVRASQRLLQLAMVAALGLAIAAVTISFSTINSTISTSLLVVGVAIATVAGVAYMRVMFRGPPRHDNAFRLSQRRAKLQGEFERLEAMAALEDDDLLANPESRKIRKRSTEVPG